MPVNRRALRLEVMKQARPVLVREVRPIIVADFESKKERLLEDFDADPITQEIEAGPNAGSHISSIQGAGGNLFSLLGFPAGNDPINVVRKYLRKSITLGRTRAGIAQGDKITFSTPVTIPTLSSIDAEVAQNPESKLPWDGRGFTYLIRKGIPWFFAYLFRESPPFKNSYSGTAIEAKKDGKLVHVRNAEEPVKATYLSDMLARFKKSISFK